MIAEKQLAFFQSWQAIFAAGLQAQHAIAQAWLGTATSAALGNPAAAAKAARKARAASLAIAHKGLAPVRPPCGATCARGSS
jgi:hypothetical protein